MIRDKPSLAILIFLILLGFALRLYQLDSVPFRGDEAFSALYWSGLPLADSLSSIATIEPHPPLTYIIFRSWGILFDLDHIFTLRSLSALLNVFGIAAIYAIGRHFGNNRWGMLAALMWAIHPFQIWHAQDFRNYGMWSGFSLVALWLGLLLIKYRRRTHWIAYIIFATISAFIFYMEVLVMMVLSLFVLLRHRHEKRFMMKWFTVQGAIVAGLLFGFLVLQGQLIASGTYVGTTGGLDIGQLFTRFLPTLIFGDTLPADLVSGLWIFLLVMLAVGSYFLWQHYPRYTFLLLLLGIVPPLLLSIISLRMSIFRPRYILAAAPAYVLILAGTIIVLSNRLDTGSLRRAILVLLPGIWALISVYSLNNYYNDPAYTKAPRWDALVSYLHENVADDDLIIQTSVDPAFGYYYHGDAVDIGLPADHLQSEEAIQETLESSRTQYASFWIVARTLSDWKNRGVVEAWASENMQLVRETSTEGLPVRQFMEWEVEGDAVDLEVQTTFDNLVRLVGSRVYPIPEPTGELTIWLYWQPTEKAEKQYKIFVHLIGDTNPSTGSPLWSQDDQFPQNGRIDTLSWETGTVYRDVYTLPVGDLSGEYNIVVGWYDPETGERLLTSDGIDHFVAGKVTLK